MVAGDIWLDNGSLNPGSIIWSSGATLWNVSGSAAGNFVDIDLTAEAIPLIQSGLNRVGLFKALDVGPSVGFGADIDGILPQQNFIRLSNGQWQYSETQGLSGDWILRGEIDTQGPAVPALAPAGLVCLAALLCVAARVGLHRRA